MDLFNLQAIGVYGIFILLDFIQAFDSNVKYNEHVSNWNFNQHYDYFNPDYQDYSGYRNELKPRDTHNSDKKQKLSDFESYAYTESDFDNQAASDYFNNEDKNNFEVQRENSNSKLQYRTSVQRRKQPKLKTDTHTHHSSLVRSRKHYEGGDRNIHISNNHINEKENSHNNKYLLKHKFKHPMESRNHYSQISNDVNKHEDSNRYNERDEQRQGRWLDPGSAENLMHKHFDVRRISDNDAKRIPQNINNNKKLIRDFMLQRLISSRNLLPDKPAKMFSGTMDDENNDGIPDHLDKNRDGKPDFLQKDLLGIRNIPKPLTFIDNSAQNIQSRMKIINKVPYWHNFLRQEPLSSFSSSSTLPKFNNQPINNQHKSNLHFNNDVSQIKNTYQNQPKYNTIQQDFNTENRSLIKQRLARIKRIRKLSRINRAYPANNHQAHAFALSGIGRDAQILNDYTHKVSQNIRGNAHVKKTPSHRKRHGSRINRRKTPAQIMKNYEHQGYSDDTTKPIMMFINFGDSPYYIQADKQDIQRSPPQKAAILPKVITHNKAGPYTESRKHQGLRKSKLVTTVNSRDENKDGIPDNLDLNRDGKIDPIIRNINVKIDENLDGIPDVMDKNRDGKIDTVLSSQIIKSVPQILTNGGRKYTSPAVTPSAQISNLWPILNDYSSSSKYARKTKPTLQTPLKTKDVTFTKKPKLIIASSDQLGNVGDENKDGVPDHMDLNRDGKVDPIIRSLDSRVDENLDGIPDSLDKNRDGHIDSAFKEDIGFKRSNKLKATEIRLGKALKPTTKSEEHRQHKVSNQPSLWPIMDDYSSVSFASMPHTKSDATSTNANPYTVRVGGHTGSAISFTSTSKTSQWVRENFTSDQYERIKGELIKMMNTRFGRHHLVDDNKDGLPDVLDANRDGKMDAVFVKRMKYLLEKLATKG